MKIEEDEVVSTKQKSNKGPKTATIIAILITVTVLALIIIIYAIMAIRGKKLSVVVDGVETQMADDTFIFTDEGKIYVSIRDIAPYVGYEAHNGEYKIDVEDTNKMYVEAKDGTETTSFFLNSTTISKVAPNTTDDYENITIPEPVTSINGKMYIVGEGFIVGFNSLLSYNSEQNQITIQTLPSLLEQYSAVIEQYGYTTISEDFKNQKALIYGMIVASKESTEKFGVIKTDGTEILSPRYNEIEFVEGLGEFIITNSSSKVGIAYADGKTKITVAYDEIKIMDSDLGLYLVKSNNKYGVIDANENTVIHIEYDQIGVDTGLFPADNIQNQYILYDTIVPCFVNEKWRLFDTKGNRITENEYDELGFIKDDSNQAVENNSLAIGDTKTIVVGVGEAYGGVDVKGNELIQIRFDEIYSRTNAGQTTYYILFNGTEYNAVDYINAMKEALGYEEEETETDIQPEENAGNQNENTTGGSDVDTNEIANEVANVVEITDEEVMQN